MANFKCFVCGSQGQHELHICNDNHKHRVCEKCYGILGSVQGVALDSETYWHLKENKRRVTFEARLNTSFQEVVYEFDVQVVKDDDDNDRKIAYMTSYLISKATAKHPELNKDFIIVVSLWLGDSIQDTIYCFSLLSRISDYTNKGIEDGNRYCESHKMARYRLSSNDLKKASREYLGTDVTIDVLGKVHTDAFIATYNSRFDPNRPTPTPPTTSNAKQDVEDVEQDEVSLDVEDVEQDEVSLDVEDVEQDEVSLDVESNTQGSQMRNKQLAIIISPDRASTDAKEFYQENNNASLRQINERIDVLTDSADNVLSILETEKYISNFKKAYYELFIQAYKAYKDTQEHTPTFTEFVQNAQGKTATCAYCGVVGAMLDMDIITNNQGTIKPYCPSCLANYAQSGIFVTPEPTSTPFKSRKSSTIAVKIRRNALKAVSRGIALLIVVGLAVTVYGLAHPATSHAATNTCKAYAHHAGWYVPGYGGDTTYGWHSASTHSVYGGDTPPTSLNCPINANNSVVTTPTVSSTPIATSTPVSTPTHAKKHHSAKKHASKKHHTSTPANSQHGFYCVLEQN